MSIVSVGMPLQKIGEGKGGCEAVPVGDTWSLVQGGDSVVRATFLGFGDVRPWRWFSSSLRIGLRYWSLVLGVGGVAVDSRPLLSATVLGRARSRRCAAALRLGMRHDVPSRNRNAHFVWASVPPRASCPGAHRRNSPSLLGWWRSSRCEIQWSGRHSWCIARSTLRANARCWVIFLEPLVSAPC